ncbi:sensor histidine kinase [Paracoccus beibuensis]|uniref:sensor histidine kinase n=1 Tax=Paracoccus beibuensis TaxID=547602 RepID=UPI00223EC845|nr:histidine kinase dimerization/phosphoacceptor domain -containing protein [Paracoccus beibuensis]
MPNKIAPADPRSANPDLRALDLLAGSEGAFALSILNSSPDCIKLIELDGRVSFMNSNGVVAMEIDDASTIEDRLWTSMWPEEQRSMVESMILAARRGEITTFEAYRPTFTGTPRWWHVTSAPVRGLSGQIERIVSISRDITATVTARLRLQEEVAEKDAALARQKILLGEIDHRVKNSFAAVIGLLRLQARTHAGSDAGSLLAEAASRIVTLARVHEQLHLDPGAGRLELSEYLSSLAKDLCGALNCHLDIEVELSGQVQSSPSQAAAIGQILAELMGNAVKHGGPDRQTRIVVRLSERRGKLVLSVEDDGPGLPDGFDPARSRGLGMQICRIYSTEMGGDLNFRASALGGAAVDVSLVIEPPAPGTPASMGTDPAPRD